MAETVSSLTPISSRVDVNRGILLYPLIREGQGTGHLRRCLELCSGNERCYLYIPEDTDISREQEKLISDTLGSCRDEKIVHSVSSERTWEWIVFDRKESSAEEVIRFSASYPVVGLDEAGTGRNFFSYCIDTLPGPPNIPPANLFAPEFLDVPPKQRSFDLQVNRILLTFGGEDPASLTSALYRTLVEERLFKPAQITVVLAGDSMDATMFFPQTTVLMNVRALKHRLFHYDLIFTSFGLTCFEALAAGVPVILFNPSAYHRLLSRAWGVPEVGVKRPIKHKVKRYLRQLQEVVRAESLLSRRLFDERGDRTLIRYIAERQRPQTTVCPACKTRGNRVVARFQDRSYLRCSRCELIYLLSFAPDSFRYDRDYFFGQYKEQYGKTYLDDFDHIRNLGEERIKRIVPFLHDTMKKKTLLDIGCAYGPFLQAANDAGFAAYGIDISRPAVAYVQDVLHIPAVVAGVADFEPSDHFNGIGKFDVISMWFVLEHLPWVEQLCKRVYSWLKEGGVFCFSTPTSRGVSGRRNLNRFLEQSPSDHHTVWNPTVAKQLLRDFGFRTKTVVITGHHPERFPWIHKKKGFAYRLTMGLSRVIGWGDTFELYAVKDSSPEEKNR